ncbi:MAG: hypothetical protein CME19_10700 [Gemmatimonadetes bacterium]|nr:hypothetical protein [Gemmatimonadota bacterium]|tara:strand:+ start:484 stop:663 length:180 start_codon:yes stop_codon:yes gene_type:complete
MTDFADITPDDKVLEIGTGSGYQAAVLAEMTDSVYSIGILFRSRPIRPENDCLAWYKQW